MRLQVEIVDLRRMLKEKCDEIFQDKKLSAAFYYKICEIEDDERFTVVKDQLSSIYGIQGGSNNGQTL